MWSMEINITTCYMVVPISIDRAIFFYYYSPFSQHTLAPPQTRSLCRSLANYCMHPEADLVNGRRGVINHACIQTSRVPRLEYLHSRTLAKQAASGYLRGVQNVVQIERHIILLGAEPINFQTLTCRIGQCDRPSAPVVIIRGRRGYRF